jgi:hypothetical protein
VRPDGTPARQPSPCPSGAGMCDADGTQLATAAQRALGAQLPGGFQMPKGPLGVPKVLP